MSKGKIDLSKIEQTKKKSESDSGKEYEIDIISALPADMNIIITGVKK